MSHTEDIEAHIQSVHEDTEYWGAKRLQGRIFRMIRKGKLSFYEILKASSETLPSLSYDSASSSFKPGESAEDRISALEVRLGDLIKGINIAVALTGDQITVDESREENGTYNPSFRYAHREITGTVDDRLRQLSGLLTEYQTLLECFFKVLTNRSTIRENRLREMLAASIPPNYENGAKIVAKAWLEPAFKANLLSDAKRTLRELNFALNKTPKLVVLEDTESIHNVIVCTLCSCYPYELLGNPPWWYKDDNYKEAIMKNPRKTLNDMYQLKVPDELEVRVYDSASDIRYMVLPKRPEGTESMGEADLAKLVTENSLIGVGEPLKPELIREKPQGERRSK